MENILILTFLSKIRYLGLIGLIFIVTACETDLLTEEPKTVAAEVFYNTAEEVETGVNAIYSRYRAREHAIFMGVLDLHTDYGYGRGSYAGLNEFQGFNQTEINRSSGFWNMLYLGVRNANLVIQNAPNGNSISQEDINKYVAEAKFLRAYGYFHLVRNWGAVPLRLETNMMERNVGRSSEAEIYDLIISDLRDAEINLLDTPTHIGRPSLWSAKTFLADVYLHREMYAEARDKANEVIQSGKFSLVPVETRDDFNKIFGPAVLTTTEDIFSIQFARQPGNGNYLPFILNHPSTGLYNFGGAYAHYGDSTDPFYTNWDENDLRKELWDIVNFGLGATTMVNSKFHDQLAVGNHDAGNNHPVYRYAEVLLIYAEAATRAANAPTTEAVEALNMVHRRAYGEDPNLPSAFDINIEDYDEESFVDLILDERGYEFIFEGKRWYTLKRTGKAQEILLENRGVSDIAARHYLWPIPISETDYNDAIDPTTDQNPGY